jgi:hypothetical protein
MQFEALLTRLAQTVSGTHAHDVVSRLSTFHRIQASPGYDEALGLVRELLRRGGIESAVHDYPADGLTKTFAWTAPPAWSIRSGCLTQVSPATRELVCFDEAATSVLAHSPGGTVEADLVHVGKGITEEDYAGIDAAGRFVLACGRGATVVRRAIRQGAAGVVIYPGSERAAASHDLVQYAGIFPKAEEIPSLVPAFSISRRTADALLAALAKGPVRLRGKVDAAFIDGALRVLEAWIPGNDPEAGEVLLVAHLCHPRASANDNASGSAVLVELATALERLRGEIPLRNTIRFLWVPEFHGTLPWAAAHVRELRAVRYVVNLDMVGQSPERLGEPLRIFRTPNAIPSYLNAALGPIAAAVAAHPQSASRRGSLRPLHVLVGTPSGGSDHLVFSAAPHRLPAVMLGHDDPYWHTDLDTPDKVDPSRLKQAAMIAGALAALPSLAPEEAPLLREWLLADAVRVMTTAAALSRRLDASLRPRLLNLALETVQANARELDELLAAPREDSWPVLRHLRDSLSPGNTSAEPIPPSGPAPRRACDGPFLPSLADTLGPEDKAVFDETLSANHGALVESLLNLCDGTRSPAEIAHLLSLDVDRIVPAADVERAVAVLETLGYIET